MDISTLKPENFVIRTEDNPTTSAIAYLNGKAVLLSFSVPFANTLDYNLEMVALRDTNRTPLPDEESVLSFYYFMEDIKKPFIEKWEFESNHSLLLTFNIPMNSNTISNTSNFELIPSGSVEYVESIDESERSFRLHLSDNTYGRSSGVTTYISFTNLESQQGVRFDEGNRLALVSESKSIVNLMVYPQPAVAEEGWLMFSNIVQGTSIKIFDINGHLITNLEEFDQNGGVRWDLRDQSGNKVPSGVYIYHATLDNQTKLGKFTIIK
jgi:hypothetical protein